MYERTENIRVDLSVNDNAIVDSVWQYDHGLTLTAVGLTPEQVPQFHFTNGMANDAVSLLTTADTSGYATTDIPDVLLAQAKDIIVYLYYEDTDSGYTVKTITIPVRERVKPETITMNLPQMGQVNTLAVELEQMIEENEALMNMGVEVTTIGEDEQGSGELVVDGQGNRTLELNIPSGATGPAPELAVSATRGADASVTTTPIYEDEKLVGYSLDFILPKGDTGATGPTPELNISASQGSSAGASSTPIYVDGQLIGYSIAFTLPKGDPGNTGQRGPAPVLQFATPITGAPGDPVSVSSQEITQGGEVIGYTLTFTIPKGDTGSVSGIFNDSMAPLAPGTASTGTDSYAARRDHRHPSQVNITGNAATANRLAVAVQIGGAQFDGTASISLQQMGALGSINNKTSTANGALTLTPADLNAVGSVVSGIHTITPEDGILTIDAGDIDIGDGRSVADAIDAVSASDVSIVVPSTGWTQETGYAYQSISSDINSDALPITTTTKFFIDVDLSRANSGTESTVLSAYGLIGRVVGNNGSVMFYCYGGIPSVNLPINIRGVG